MGFLGGSDRQAALREPVTIFAMGEKSQNRTNDKYQRKTTTRGDRFSLVAATGFEPVTSGL